MPRHHFALPFLCNEKGRNYHFSGHNTSISSSHLMTPACCWCYRVMRFALLGDFIIQALGFQASHSTLIARSRRFFGEFLLRDAQIQELHNLLEVPLLPSMPSLFRLPHRRWNANVWKALRGSGVVEEFLSLISKFLRLPSHSKCCILQPIQSINK